MLVARPLLPLVPGIAEAAAVSPHAPALIPRAPSTVPVPAHPLTSRYRSNSIRTDFSGAEELGVTDHSALSDSTPSAETPYSVQEVYPGSLSETEDVKSFMGDIRSACSLLNRGAPKSDVDLAEMSVGWLSELTGQERTLQRRHAVQKPEVGEVI